MKAAVLDKLNVPLGLGNVECPDQLVYGQVLVKVLVAGICGSQLQEIDGIKSDPKHLPNLLGHEGCGIVEEIGEGVITVSKGDKVVMHWRKGDGIEAAPAIYSGGVKAGPITTFSEYAVVSENRVTKVPQDTPDDFAALLGCALSTSLAIIENEARPKIGDKILIIGCGGLGLALMFAARHNQECHVYAVDICDKSKIAESVGGMFSGFKETELSEPFDIIIDTVGSSLNNLVWMRIGGKYISLQAGGTSAGGFNPTKDIPRYVQMWRSGKLNGWENIITHRLPLSRINEGIELMRAGKAGRVMIQMHDDN